MFDLEYSTFCEFIAKNNDRVFRMFRKNEMDADAEFVYIKTCIPLGNGDFLIGTTSWEDTPELEYLVFDKLSEIHLEFSSSDQDVE